VVMGASSVITGPAPKRRDPVIHRFEKMMDALVKPDDGAARRIDGDGSPA